MLRFRIVLVATYITFAAWATTATATTLVRELPFEDVVAGAARIVVGTVNDIRYARDDEGVPATWVTLAVWRNLRGPNAKQVTIKQFGVAEPLSDGTLARVPGIPQYRLGEEIVIFLRGESARGFTSPVGLARGVYRVDRAQGSPSVKREAPGQDPEDLESFLARVQRLAAREH